MSVDGPEREPEPPFTSAPAVTQRERLVRARARAQELVEDLQAELAAIAESTEAGPDDEHDAEGATVGYERARVAGLLHRAQAALADVDGALARERAGLYGTCALCGNPIAPERLATLPTTPACVACADAAPRPPWSAPGSS